MDVIRDKEKLYRLIVGQLQYDGYVQVSKNLLQQGWDKNFLNFVKLTPFFSYKLSTVVYV